jgi:hypothetical protein
MAAMLLEIKKPAPAGHPEFQKANPAEAQSLTEKSCLVSTVSIMRTLHHAWHYALIVPDAPSRANYLPGKITQQIAANERFEKRLEFREHTLVLRES